MNLSKEKYNVLVIRASYTKAYPIVESLKKAGYRVIVGVDERITELHFSVFPDKFVYIVNPYLSEKLYINSVLKAIEDNNIDIVVPVGFIDFLLLSKYKQTLEKFTVIPTDDYEKIASLSNKWYINRIADSIKINYPKTLLLNEKPDLAKIRSFIENTGYPIVVKGMGDDSKPKFVSCFDDLLKEIESRTKDKVLLQEFIPGSGAGYFALSYKGQPLAEFMHKRILEIHPLGGASVKASANYDPELLQLGRKLIKAVNWTGVLMIEFRKNAETGDYYLIEINPKFWGSLELAYRAGVDFPRYLVEFFLEGKRPSKVLVKNISFSWVASTLSSYSKYGLKTALEALRRVLPKSPMLSDLHPHDPPNFVIKSAHIIRSIFKASRNEVKIETVYLTEHLKKILQSHDLKLIVSDLDGTLVKLSIPWKKIVEQGRMMGLIKPYKSINESLVQYYNSRNTEMFMKLNEFLEKYELDSIRRCGVKHTDTRFELPTLLKTAKEKSILFVIISMQSRKAILECLDKIGIREYVDMVVSRETTPIRSEALRKVVEELNITSPGIFFGDTLVDVKAAFKNDLIPCRVVRNNLDRIQTLEMGVSYTDSVSKIIRLIISHRR